MYMMNQTETFTRPDQTKRDRVEIISMMVTNTGAAAFGALFRASF